MKRINMPQVSQQSWFPAFLRRNIHEFLTWFVHQIKAAKPFMPIVEEGLNHADNIIFLDGKSGAGIETLEPFLDSSLEVSHDSLYNPSLSKSGLYVSVNSFHQLPMKKAKNLLEGISKSQNPIVVLEGNNDSLWQVVGMTVFVPLTVILTAPMVKPFRWSRIIFTYLLPILPFITFLDGFLALFKLYAPKDLNELTASLPVSDERPYYWRSGKLDNGRGGKIIYLIGYPERATSSTEAKILEKKHIN
ncbi:MAG: hypothetical protein MRZ79_17050 [Bacteroidia bacterium]|nr:hypothetical protein [Bacteroidia bacterium]